MTLHGTVLAFDYGGKRIGVAVGQTVTKTARPLVTLNMLQQRPDWDALDKIIKEWRPAALVVGMPRNMDDTEHTLTPQVTRFGKQLTRRYHLNVHYVDERLSSIAAEENMRTATMSKQRRMNKATIDQFAAQVILEQFLNLDPSDKIFDANER